MQNKPTVKKSVLADAAFIGALMPVCGYLEAGDVKLLAHKIAAITEHAGRKHEGAASEDCRLCSQNIGFMHALPPQVSAVALENPNKRDMRTKFSSIIYENAMRREQDRKKSKRANRDFYATAVLFSTHKKQHPELYR